MGPRATPAVLSTALCTEGLRATAFPSLPWQAQAQTEAWKKTWLHPGPGAMLGPRELQPYVETAGLRDSLREIKTTFFFFF